MSSLCRMHMISTCKNSHTKALVSRFEGTGARAVRVSLRVPHVHNLHLPVNQERMDANPMNAHCTGTLRQQAPLSASSPCAGPEAGPAGTTPTTQHGQSCQHQRQLSTGASSAPVPAQHAVQVQRLTYQHPSQTQFQHCPTNQLPARITSVPAQHQHQLSTTSPCTGPGAGPACGSSAPRPPQCRSAGPPASRTASCAAQCAPHSAASPCRKKAWEKGSVGSASFSYSCIEGGSCHALQLSLRGGFGGQQPPNAKPPSMQHLLHTAPNIRQTRWLVITPTCPPRLSPP